MNDVTWTIHHVIDSSNRECILNNHTHGMEQYEHLDFQLVLNLPPKEVGRLLNTMGMRVQNGEHFLPGEMVSDLYEDCDVRLDLAKETGRHLLRLVIPDAQNRFPEDPDCTEPYKHQILPMFEE